MISSVTIKGDSRELDDSADLQWKVEQVFHKKQ